jgi:hypothetical protein
MMTRVGRLLFEASMLALLVGFALPAPPAHAYPMYDDGNGNGCVQCHNGFLGGNGPLHTQHRTRFNVTTCNLCHPNGGGSTPVLTYWSGTGGGRGCAGCHGQDYGETSPNSNAPKSTSYGLRLFHVSRGVTACGTSGCHQPGALGAPNPFPPVFGENVAPVYYAPAYSSLTDPCASLEEDLPFDNDTVGLDNDGNGLVDFPADPNCGPPTTTTTSTTLPFLCGAAPASGCISPGKGSLLVNEKAPGKEKLKVSLTKIPTTVTTSQFGNPASGSTKYKVCIYGSTNALKGQFIVDRAGATCGTGPCWSAVSTKGYKYNDKAGTADGITKMTPVAGIPGKGKVVVNGKNDTAHLPLGIAAQLQNETSATVQVLTSDASCFGAFLNLVKKADGTIFSAGGP